MSNRDQLMTEIRNLQYDRLSIQMMHDDIVRLNDDLVEYQNSHHSDNNSLREERDRLMESLKLTVNHVARLERLIGLLSPEEQLVLDRMLINPYKKCTIDLMEELHCEMSSVYRLRAAAIEKLLHLRYGAGAGE